MPWTEITREQYRHLRYASDATEAEWLLLSFFLPAPQRVGRPRQTDRREVVNAIFYILGDVDFDGVRQKASLITPVPGGVGPMTATMLLANTIASAED